MKLRYAAPSPFVRKVMIVAIESGLRDRIELLPVAVAPTTPNDAVASENPLVKVPTLITDDGETLFDSRVACEYLDALGGKGLFPREGAARWTALRQQALGDGLLDAAILIRYETFLRPAELRWPDWIAGQMRKVRGALDAMEASVASFADGPLTIGPIAIACALGYLDFRYADEGWRNTRPKLAAWYEGFAQRPSMLATELRAPS